MSKTTKHYEGGRKHSGSLALTWVQFPAQSVAWIGPGGKA